MADAAGTLPGLDEVRGWIGFTLDDVGGKEVGRVVAAYADADSGEPAWLVVAFGRRRRAKAVVVPLRECAGMVGRAWTAQGREAVRESPAVDSGRPLLREHEVTICAHYGIGERVGRHAEVAGRPEGSVTAQPA